MPISMPTLPYNFPEYDPFWDIAGEYRDVPVAFHVFTVGPTGQPPSGPHRGGPGQDLASEIVDMAHAMNPLTLLVASGALERHPGLKFVLVEGGVGWLAWVLQIHGRDADKASHVGRAQAQYEAQRVFPSAGIRHLRGRSGGAYDSVRHWRREPDVGERLPARRGHIPLTPER